ncbi:hypothetical protein XELAEV_18036992mg [Xenopus laevis]|uniref:Protein kinase domain-containing protein n=1 Tax=Xenopus laevis TaxID=8355 RepID=A0A974CCE3_XENLA|nr:hypothetical protein XELAEV_18036992mg [Xenopus laevis]
MYLALCCNGIFQPVPWLGFVHGSVLQWYLPACARLRYAHGSVLQWYLPPCAPVGICTLLCAAILSSSLFPGWDIYLVLCCNGILQPVPWLRYAYGSVLQCLCPGWDMYMALCCNGIFQPVPWLGYVPCSVLQYYLQACALVGICTLLCAAMVSSSLCPVWDIYLALCCNGIFQPVPWLGYVPGSVLQWYLQACAQVMMSSGGTGHETSTREKTQETVPLKKMKRIRMNSGQSNSQPSKEKKRRTEYDVEEMKKKKSENEDQTLQKKEERSLDEQLEDKGCKAERIRSHSRDLDPQLSKEKKRKGEHQEDDDQELQKKRERSSDEQLPDECCREKKQRREETDEGGAGPVSSEAQSSRLNPLSVTSYTFCSVLGAGSFGKVRLAMLGDKKSYVAVKTIKKTEETDYNSLLTESQVLNIARYSPFLCQGFAAFQTQRHVFYVMEYLSGGSLETELLKHGTLDMDRVRFHSAEMICGLQYLHGVGIIHRDLKPVNVLLDHQGHAKISDFGLAKQSIFEDDLTTGWAGTLGYMAPELMQANPYNAAVDWWSFGVTICEIATGMSPFNDSDIPKLIDSIKFHEPEIPDWLDKDLQHLLGKLLVKDRKQRLGVRGDIRSHPFYKPIDWVALEEDGLQPPFQPRTPSAELYKPHTGKLSFIGSQEDKATSGDSDIIAGFSFQSSTWLT